MKMFSTQLMHPVLQGQAMLACGTKRGKILIYQLTSGKLLAEVENAHYLAVSDLDVSTAGFSSGAGDLIITGGKDSKIKVWFLSQLIALNPKDHCFAEFGDHSSEVTCVRFSQSSST